MNKEEQVSRIITEAARNQFDSSFLMLERLVDVCPDEVWLTNFSGDPFWYHAYHVTYFVDYWFRCRYDDSDFRSMTFDGRIPPEFEHDVPEGVSISRADMREYLTRIKSKTAAIFSNLDDAHMAQPIIEGQKNYTYMDVITSQIRHIMYNVGYLNGILRSKGLEESDWYAYNEEDE
jgi:hypothetical protein